MSIGRIRPNLGGRTNGGTGPNVPFPEFDEGAPKTISVTLASGNQYDLPSRPDADVLDVVSSAEGYDVRNDPAVTRA